jgi:hypothetical protein
MESTQARRLITDARRAGVMLWVKGDRLHYSTPWGGMPAALRDGLQSRRHEIAAELSQPIFEKRAAQEQLPLPAYFEDFWHETRSSLSLANATHMAVKITGESSLQRLHMAFELAFSRHDLLRARLSSSEGLPSLLFDAHPQAPITIADLSGCNPDERLARVKEVVEKTIWARFEGGSLFRACLLKVSAREYVFGFVLHHLIGDLSSCHLLMRDFLMRAFQPGDRADSTAPPPLQYSDYLLAMSEWLSGPALKYRLAWWKEQMGAALPVCFPADHESGAAAVTALDSVSFEIDEPLRDGIVRVAASSGVSLLAVLLAAHFSALAGILRRSDLVINPITAGRNHPALSRLVGMIADCVPVRVSVLPEMTFLELLHRAHKTYLLACSYHVPWALLRKALREIDVSCVSPLLNFVPGVYGRERGAKHSLLPAQTTVEGITVEGPPDTTSVDWKSHEVHVFDSGHLMKGKVKYMPLKYRRETIEAFVAVFIRRLEAIAANPGTRLQDVVD